MYQRRARLLAYTGLGDAYALLAEIGKDPASATADRRAALENYHHVLDIMQEFRSRGIADADDLAEMDEVARKATECEKALAEKE